VFINAYTIQSRDPGLLKIWVSSHCSVSVSSNMSSDVEGEKRPSFLPHEMSNKSDSQIISKHFVCPFIGHTIHKVDRKGL